MCKGHSHFSCYEYSSKCCDHPFCELIPIVVLKEVLSCPLLYSTAKKQEKAFLDEDGELKSISDAGSIDDIDSDHEDPPEFENPMTQMAASAMSTLHTGELLGMPPVFKKKHFHLSSLGISSLWLDV